MINPFYQRSLISIADLSKQELLYLIDIATLLSKDEINLTMQGKILATCFFEASTRTRLSFESAMLRLGGQVLGFADSNVSSTKKGESIIDTIKVVENYADIIVLRHPQEGSAKLAAESISIPVINAGDGANQHPSQTLLDLFTIHQIKNSLENISIVMMGDLKYGRTVHSLTQALSLFQPRMYFVSPPELKIPIEIIELLKSRGIRFSFHSDLEEIIDLIDILYMTRMQRERFSDTLISSKKTSCGINLSLLKKAKPSMKILYPLPRNEEIPREIDATNHAYYFKQAENGVIIRKALLLAMSNLEIESLLCQC